MGILSRVKNAYRNGGIVEIARKLFFYSIYKINGFLTYLGAITSPPEYGLTKEKRKTEIVISLTSFPPRFSNVGLCLKSLTQQKCKPDKIIVYLGNDTLISDITDEMHEYEKYGIQFVIDNNNNLMPHKKYYYAMQQFPNSIIVTADDDIIYPKNWLESLYNSYKKYPKSVSAWRVHHITKKFGKMDSYDQWVDQCRTIRRPSMELIATGNGGVLYPPHCFDQNTFDINNIIKLCLRTDDIWLKCMEVRLGISVVWVKNWKVMPFTIDFSNNNRLTDENVFTGKNDEVLRCLMDEYSLSENMFFD